MDSTAQSQFLRIYSGGITRLRAQNFYAARTVTWEEQPWVYVPFVADGIVAGDLSSESSMTVGMPATAVVLEALRSALRYGDLLELRQYEFDPQAAPDQPLEGQLLVASYLGEVVGLGGGLGWLELELGSALSPVGVQIPPRTMTSQLIGTPCQL
jgi:hypothetical protein